MKNIFLFFLIIFTFTVGISNAEEPIYDGKYYSWDVFKLTKDNGEKMCYIATYPTKVNLAPGFFAPCDARKNTFNFFVTLL